MSKRGFRHFGVEDAGPSDERGDFVVKSGAGRAFHGLGREAGFMAGWWARAFVSGASMACILDGRTGADRAASAFLNFGSSAAAYPYDGPAKAPKARNGWRWGLAAR